jgi:uncharacterized membrane protein (UPF0136 family)
MANIKFNLGSIILIVILAIIGGIIGRIFHQSSQFFNLTILIGCILGAGLGFAIMLMKQKNN